MRRLSTALTLAAAGLVLAAPASLMAQPPAGAGTATGTGAGTGAAADSTTQLIESYVRAHLALAAVRDKEQAELAEPRSKKAEVQAEIRQRYRGLRAEALKGAGYTEAHFTAVTKRISTDDALRGKFEAALARPVAR